MKNEDVCREWSCGFSGHSQNMSTDGKNLYSYNLKIGYTDSLGRKILYWYRSPKNYISMTTSIHVGRALRYANQVIDPTTEEYA